VLRCPQCDSHLPDPCSCGQRLDGFLRALHEELQQDGKTLFMLELGKLGRISLHWSQ
jgi:hypothetical protein